MKNPKYTCFILWERRSGSNLLRTRLHALQEIAAPHPPHIIHNFQPILHHYWDLSNNKNFQRLLWDIIEFCNLSPVPLVNTKSKIEVWDIKRCIQQKSLVWIHNAVYTYIMNTYNADIWVCKSNDNIYYLNQIESELWETTKYIHLIRDGRDVFSSFKKATIGPKHPYFAAKQWEEQQDILEKFSHKFPWKVLIVKYEDLIGNTQSEFKKICDFLNIPFEYSVINNAHLSNEALNTAEKSHLWKNVNKPIIQNNSQKFTKELNTKEIEIYESVASKCLEKYWYSLTTKWSLKFSKKEIETFQEKNKFLQQKFKQQWDSWNRSQQSEFIKQITCR